MTECNEAYLQSQHLVLWSVMKWMQGQVGGVDAEIYALTLLWMETDGLHWLLSSLSLLPSTLKKAVHAAHRADKSAMKKDFRPFTFACTRPSPSSPWPGRCTGL